MTQLSIDIAIIGGGISGLWTLARLRKAGYQVVLLEADALGSVQTGASQGIIHGGTKYALTGKLTHSAQSIQAMPQRWKDCLEGRGEVDLTHARKLSAHQYLWSNKSIASRLTGFFASKVMSSRMRHLPESERMPPFNQANFQGEVYKLDEPVLDIKSVIEAIRTQYASNIIQMNVTSIHKQEKEACRFCLNPDNKPFSLCANTLILTAGAGNKKLLEQLEQAEPRQQLRPLLMPMLKASKSVLPELYAHCLGASALPKMTITSHPLGKDRMVWYLGGEIAEQGVGKSDREQIVAAKKELHKLMPWMDFSSCEWSVLAIDRAEPEMPDGSRPAEPFVNLEQNIITAWPVKLAMAPIMADKVLEKIQQTDIKLNSQIPEGLSDHNVLQAKTSALPWEKITAWVQ